MRDKSSLGLHSLVVRLGCWAAVACILWLFGLAGGLLWSLFSGWSACLVGCCGLHSLVLQLGWWAALACIRWLTCLAGGLLWPAFSGWLAWLLGCYSLQSLDGRVGVFSCGMFDIHRSSNSCGGLARFFGIARLACKNSQKGASFSKYFRPAMGHPI